jgi:hypothetical protein
MNAASGINIILGLWLIVSTWIVGYLSDAILWNNIIVGAAILVLALSRATARSRASVRAG